MISLNSPAFLSLNLCDTTLYNPNNTYANFSDDQEGNHQSRWKNTLNNFSLFIQPILILWLIYPGLEISPNSNLLLGFKHLIDAINQFQPFYSSA
jgi:hypothetical protein